MNSVSKILVFCSILVVLVPTAYAASLPDNTKTIGLQLSQTCRIMVVHNITSNCPSYEDLYDLGWDSSLPGSGEFYYDDTGFYKRGQAAYKDVHELYRYFDNHILVDPPSEIASRAKLIIISPSLPTYIPPGEYKKEDNSRTLAKDRYVESCKVATITAENWEFLIADTIFYLRSDCTHTVFEHLWTVDDYISSMNIATSAKYKHDKWVEESKIKCKEICKEY